MAQQVFPPLPDDEQLAAGSDDADLVRRTLRGDEDAFAILFDRHSPRVTALALHLVGERSEAEDITQDAFLQALSALPTLRQPDAFGAWVARIASNASLTVLRRRSRLPQSELTEAVIETSPDSARWGSPEAMGLATEEQHSIQVTLDRLAPSHRAALALREVGGLSYAEMAETLGITSGGVEALLFRARARFRDEFTKVSLGAAPIQPATTCKQAQRALAALADDELAEPQRVEVVAHVRGCGQCTATIQAQRDARRMLLALPIFVPASLKLSVLAKVAPLLASYAGAGAGGAVGGALSGGAAGGAAGAIAASASAGTSATAGGAAIMAGAASGASAAGVTAGGAAIAAGGASVAAGVAASGAISGAAITAATATGVSVAVAAGSTAAVAAGSAVVAGSTVAAGSIAAGVSAAVGSAVAALGTTGIAATAAAVAVAGAVAIGVLHSPNQHPQGASTPPTRIARAIAPRGVGAPPVYRATITAKPFAIGPKAGTIYPTSVAGNNRASLIAPQRHWGHGVMRLGYRHTARSSVSGAPQLHPTSGAAHIATTSRTVSSGAGITAEPAKATSTVVVASLTPSVGARQQRASMTTETLPQTLASATAAPPSLGQGNTGAPPAPNQNGAANPSTNQPPMSLNDAASPTPTLQSVPSATPISGGQLFVPTQTPSSAPPPDGPAPGNGGHGGNTGDPLSPLAPPVNALLVTPPASDSVAATPTVQSGSGVGSVTAPVTGTATVVPLSTAAGTDTATPDMPTATTTVSSTVDDGREIEQGGIVTPTETEANASATAIIVLANNGSPTAQPALDSPTASTTAESTETPSGDAPTEAATAWPSQTATDSPYPSTATTVASDTSTPDAGNSTATTATVVPTAPVADTPTPDAGNATADAGSGATNTPSPTISAGTIQLAAASGQAGSHATVAGSNFTPGALVQIKFFCTNTSCDEGSITLATAHADNQGQFKVSLAIPPYTPLGPHIIGAIDSSTGHFTHVQLQVGPRPVLTLSPSSGASGDPVTISGSHFGPDEDVPIRAYCSSPDCDGAALLAIVHTDATGSFSHAMIVPSYSPVGPHLVGAVDGASGTSAVGVYRVTQQRVLALSANSGPPGTPLLVSGSGFAADELITLKVFCTLDTCDNGATLLGTAQADDSGAFSFPIVMPSFAPTGPHLIGAQGARSGVMVTGIFLTTAPPRLTLSTDVGPAGTVTVSGSSFTPNTHLTVSIFCTYSECGRGSVNVGSAQTDANGAFSQSITIPSYAPAGSHIIGIDGGGLYAVTTYTVTGG